ncbi:MAG: hypothetical protein HDQ88_02455 [Clostridia bacterium]|nr:hypothetical protein [Clostridia bacterium]
MKGERTNLPICFFKADNIKFIPAQTVRPALQKSKQLPHYFFLQAGA